MNIQIIGKNKCFATKSAERFFKERKIKYQYIDILDKGLAARVLDAIVIGIRDIDLIFDKKCPLYETLFVAHIVRDISAKKELLLAHPTLLVTPIVRDCDTKKCTVGKAEEVWKSWN